MLDISLKNIKEKKFDVDSLIYDFFSSNIMVRMHFSNNEKLTSFVLLSLLKVCFSFSMAVFIMATVNVFGSLVFAFVFFFCRDFFGKGGLLRNRIIKNCFFNRIEETVFEKCLSSSGVFSALVDPMGNSIDVSTLESLLFAVTTILYNADICT